MASIDDVDQLRRNPDDAVAANWYLRAARQQQPDAVYAAGYLSNTEKQRAANMVVEWQQLSAGK